MLFLWTDAVMPHNVMAFFQNILFISGLKRVVVVDDIGNPLVVALVGHHADVVGKYHNIAALPLVDLGNVRCQRDGGVGKVYVQVADTAEVNVRVGFLNVIFLWMGSNVLRHQFFQVIACG